MDDGSPQFMQLTKSIILRAITITSNLMTKLNTLVDISEFGENWMIILRTLVIV